MNNYSTKRLRPNQVCFVAFVTLFAAASASAQTIAPPLFNVTHDATIQGNGTTGSPLTIAASPTVGGSLTVTGDIQAKNIVSTNSTVSDALTVNGNIQANTVVDDLLNADSIKTQGLGVQTPGTGSIQATGSANNNGIAGVGGDSGFGVRGEGGNGEIENDGGVGVLGQGGTGINGGIGVKADGADAASGFTGGIGVAATGGFDAGVGMVAIGGEGFGNGNVGGTGIFAFGGAGLNGADDGFAGVFNGDVLITGKVVKNFGTFKIDHPLDPENKYLSHSFVESPDMMNIYNGDVTTDSNGDALVQLPEYFGALNRDFRYQLTVLGTSFAKTFVAEKITENHFRIKTTLPNVVVSWQVTGIRQDAYANKNRIAVEEDKPESERGLYLHPEAFNKPREKGIEAAERSQVLRPAEPAKDVQKPTPRPK